MITKMSSPNNCRDRQLAWLRKIFKSVCCRFNQMLKFVVGIVVGTVGVVVGVFRFPFPFSLSEVQFFFPRNVGQWTSLFSATKEWRKTKKCVSFQFFLFFEKCSKFSFLRLVQNVESHWHNFLFVSKTPPKHDRSKKFWRRFPINCYHVE